jgi:hypothetical protein
MTNPMLTYRNCFQNHQLIPVDKWQNDYVSKKFCFLL